MFFLELFLCLVCEPSIPQGSVTLARKVPQARSNVGTNFRTKKEKIRQESRQC